MRIFYIFTLFACLLFPLNYVFAAPATVGTSTSSSATANTAQRKSFYDTVNSKHWAFYYNGSAIAYAYSADNSSWTAVSTLAYDTTNFSVSYKAISGTGYVFVAVEADTYDVVLRRGTVGSTSITFDSAITVFDGASASDKYTRPNVTLSASNSENYYVWLAAVYDNGNGYVARARKSSDTATGDLSSWGDVTSVGKVGSPIISLVFLPQTYSDMLLLINGDLPNIVAYSGNGSTWTEQNTGGDYSWFNFGPTINGTIRAVATNGSDTYLGGDFTNLGNSSASYIARWDGSAWNALGAGTNNIVRAIAVSDSDVYVGGDFTTAGGIANTKYLAHWNGSNWSALGTGIQDNNSVYAIALSGTDVYAGGYFFSAGGFSTAKVAHWDGSSWSALGTGINGSFSYVYALAVSGSDVYAGGDFNTAGGVTGTAKIARWDGSAWNAMGTGMDGTVYSLKISGSDVYAGGAFTAAGAVSCYGIQRWNGSAWNAVGTGTSGASFQVYSIVINGSDVYAGGGFSAAGGASNTSRIARWNGTSWNAMGTGMNSGSSVYALALNGSNIYAGGDFTTAGGVSNTTYIARWDSDSSTWNRFPGNSAGLNGITYAIALSDSYVYAGGAFTEVGGVANTKYIARWDGSVWSALNIGTDNIVRALAVSGSDIYVGGDFTSAGSASNTRSIAKWNGGSWSALGTGTDGSVRALATSGSDVYAGGTFTAAGGVSDTAKIAKAEWNGTSFTWKALGTGGAQSTVFALAVSGSDVYAGGAFTTAGGVANTKYIARWNGTSWNAMGTTGMKYYVYALAISGSDVYAGGEFATAGGVANTANIARWDGSTWNALGTGIGNIVRAISINGSDVYAGGDFTSIGSATNMAYLARWNGSTWSAVGTAALSKTYALGSSDSDLYVGSAAISPGGGAYFSKYGLAVAKSYQAGGISTVSDSSNRIHLAYLDTSSYPTYKYFNGSSWQAAVSLGSNASTSPSLSVYPNTNITLSWVESNAIKYKSGVDPYASGDWSGSATTLYSTGTNANLNVQEQATSTSGPLATWTNGTSNPYSVLSDFPASDITAPTTTASGNNGDYTFGTWSSSSVTVTLSCDDGGGSGCATTYYCTDTNNSCTPSSTYSTGVEISTVGTSYIRYYSVDSSSNSETAKSSTVKIDASAPTTTANGNGYTFGNWSSSNVTVSLSCDDSSGSGCATTYYCTDTNNSCTPSTTYSGNVEISTGGTSYIRYYSTDNAANSETAKSSTVRIDTAVPTTTASGNGGSYTFGTWSTSNVTVSLSCDDSSGSGCATTYYCTDTDNSCSPSTTYSSPVEISTQGTSYIRYYSTDTASNSETAKSSTLKIDTVLPTVSISSTTSNPTLVSPIPITITFSESVSGFTIEDLTIEYGSASNFSGSGASYTADITPSSTKVYVTVNIAQGAATDEGGNNNTVAPEFARGYGFQRRVIITQ